MTFHTTNSSTSRWVYMCVFVRLRTCAPAWMLAHVYVHVYVYVYMCVHIYIHSQNSGKKERSNFIWGAALQQRIQTVPCGLHQPTISGIFFMWYHNIWGICVVILISNPSCDVHQPTILGNFYYDLTRKSILVMISIVKGYVYIYIYIYIYYDGTCQNTVFFVCTFHWFQW